MILTMILILIIIISYDPDHHQDRDHHQDPDHHFIYDYVIYVRPLILIMIIIASKCIAAWATMTSAESGRKITCSPSQQHPLAREKSGFYVFIDFKFRYRLICIT